MGDDAAYGAPAVAVAGAAAAPDSPSSPSAQAAAALGSRSLWSRAKSWVIGGDAHDTQLWAEQESAGEAEPSPQSFFSLAADNVKGEAVPFASFRGSVCLVVNVASF